MSNDECLMSNEIPMTNAESTRAKYDLEERTAKFGESIIKFTKKVTVNSVTQPLISQLVRSGTSVGANYCEADDSGSKKEFKYKIGICKKEARETKYWLKMMMVTIPELREEAKILWNEAKELHLIFSAIIRSINRNI